MDLDRLSLSGPDAAIAAVPYLLGFHPRESAVLLWRQDGRLALTQRLDLPDPGSATDSASAWLDAVWGHCAAATAREVIVVIFSEREPAPWLERRLQERAKSSGTTILDLIVTDGITWRSLLCASRQCCPVQGRHLDAGTALTVAAEFALAGRAPLAERGDMAREFRPDPEQQAATEACMDEELGADTGTGAGREAWRDRRIAEIVAVLLQGPGSSTGVTVSPHDAAVVALGLEDVRVRDTVLWELSRAVVAPPIVDRLAAVVRAAPAGRRAPVATVTAIVAWCTGDGARARMAVEQALDDQADYSLARLVEQALDAGLPPDKWRESMEQLTRQECRRAA